MKGILDLVIGVIVFSALTFATVEAACARGGSREECARKAESTTKPQPPASDSEEVAGQKNTSTCTGAEKIARWT